MSKQYALSLKREPEADIVVTYAHGLSLRDVRKAAEHLFGLSGVTSVLVYEMPEPTTYTDLASLLQDFPKAGNSA
jgi:hypothetical protein